MLSAFIREHSGEPGAHEQPSIRSPRRARADLDELLDEDYPSVPGGLRTDLQAAVTVLGRLPNNTDVKHRALLAHAQLNSVDLRGADLSSASLYFTDLSNARLDRANLCNAALVGANLTHALLRKTDLERARLDRARIDGADFSGALGASPDKFRGAWSNHLTILPSGVNRSDTEFREPCCSPGAHEPRRDATDPRQSG